MQVKVRQILLAIWKNLGQRPWNADAHKGDRWSRLPPKISTTRRVPSRLCCREKLKSQETSKMSKSINTLTGSSLRLCRKER